MNPLTIFSLDEFIENQKISKLRKDDKTIKINYLSTEETIEIKLEGQYLTLSIEILTWPLENYPKKLIKNILLKSIFNYQHPNRLTIGSEQSSKNINEFFMKFNEIMGNYYQVKSMLFEELTKINTDSESLCKKYNLNLSYSAK